MRITVECQGTQIDVPDLAAIKRLILPAVLSNKAVNVTIREGEKEIATLRIAEGARSTLFSLVKIF